MAHFGAGVRREARAPQGQRCRSKSEPIMIGSRQQPRETIALDFAATEPSGNGDGIMADSPARRSDRTPAMIGLALRLHTRTRWRSAAMAPCGPGEKTR